MTKIVDKMTMTFISAYFHDGSKERMEALVKGEVAQVEEKKPKKAANKRNESMVIVIIEAQVPSEKWETLRKAFKLGISEMKLFPVAELFLIQSKADPTLSRIISVWYNWADLSEAHSKGSLPGEMIFVIVGTKPITSTFNVIAHAQKPLEDL
jgi:hypothetical protein